MAIDADRDASIEGATGSSARFAPAAPASPALSRAVRFFTAVGLSFYGDWLTTVALVVVLFELTGSAIGPAAYMFVRVAPRVAGPWFGGSLSDRLGPRRVLVAAALAQAVVTALLIPLHRIGSSTGIFAVVAMSQLFGSVGRPSAGALIPQLVPADRLARANALYGMLFSTSMFVAPAIGALLLTRTGPDALFAIDALSFLAAAALIGSASGRSTRTLTGRRVGAPPEAQHFLRAAWRLAAVRLVATANFATGFVVTVTQAVLVVAAHQRFGGDAAVGYLYASVGLGGLVGGAIALGWIPSRSWTRVAIFLVATIQVVAIAGFSASSSILEALALLTLSAVTSSSFDTWGITEIQRSAPPGFMGRYNSIIFSSMYSGMLVGAVWALVAARVVAWDVSVQLACVVALVLLALVWVARPPQRLSENGAGAREP